MNLAVYLKIPPDLSGNASLMMLALHGHGQNQLPENDHDLLQEMRNARYLLHFPPIAFVMNRLGPSLDDVTKARMELAGRGLVFAAAETEPQENHALAA